MRVVSLICYLFTVAFALIFSFVMQLLYNLIKVSRVTLSGYSLADNVLVTGSTLRKVHHHFCPWPRLLFIFSPHYSGCMTLQANKMMNCCCLHSIRLSEGFHFAASGEGIVNMVTELPIQVKSYMQGHIIIVNSTIPVPYLIEHWASRTKVVETLSRFPGNAHSDKKYIQLCNQKRRPL